MSTSKTSPQTAIKGTLVPTPPKYPATVIPVQSSWYFPSDPVQEIRYVIQRGDLFLCRESNGLITDEWWAEFGHRHMVKLTNLDSGFRWQGESGTIRMLVDDQLY
jgi:hypothetical protein